MNQGAAGWTPAQAASKAGRDQGKGTAPPVELGISGAVCAIKRQFSTGTAEDPAHVPQRSKIIVPAKCWCKIGPSDRETH
jgi:hypothetical protein